MNIVLSKRGLGVLLGVLAVSVLAVGCGPKSDCQRICTEGVNKNCRASGYNCNSVCASADTDYKAVSDYVNQTATGCKDEFTAFYQCKLQIDVCVANPCSTEANMVGTCLLSSCTLLDFACLADIAGVANTVSTIQDW